jgi:hypothetical protein
MRPVRVIWRLMRRRAQRWLTPAPPAHSIVVFNPNEFSELISSGRTKDLETLAKRLSEHHRRSRANMTSRSGRLKSNSPQQTTGRTK